MITTPVWIPTNPETTRMSEFLRFVKENSLTQHIDSYQTLHTWSIQHIPEFWQALVKFFNLPFNVPLEAVFQKTGSELWQNEWFKGAQFNYANLLLQGEPDRIAIIGINEAGERRTFTYTELTKQVAACAAGLLEAGVKPKDSVAAVLPNIPETIIAMLATASIGAIWAACSPDFGAEAILERFKQIEPRVLFISDGHQYGGKTFPLSEEKLQRLEKELVTLKKTVIISASLNVTPANKRITPTAKNLKRWSQFLKSTSPFPSTHFPFSHPLYVLFSSGTTGKPKCIVHGAGNVLLQHIKELGLHCNLSSEDTLFFYTTCGWMMWNWMLSGLALGMRLVLYDGAPTYPDESRLFALIEKEKVTAFGTSAKYLSTIEKSHLIPRQHHNLSHLKLILSTGSPLLAPQYEFVYQHIHPHVQLSSISGGTDIVSCFALGNPMLPIYKGELQCLGLGLDVQVFNTQGQAIKGEKGELVCCSPFPSMPLGFWVDNNNQAYRHAYFERFPYVWTHGDFAELTPRHGLIIYGRSDTTLNPGGVRIGTAEIYHVMEKIPEILECVVISQAWQNDTRMILFVKLKSGIILNETLKKTICQQLKQHASPRHVPDLILAIMDIPKTFNGKIVELAIHQVVNGKPVQNLNAIANPEALDYFKNHPGLAQS